MDIKILTTPQYGTNCYLLENDSAAAVIDPGEIMPELLEFAEEQKDKPNRLIILTHCHFDHIGGVEAVKRIWNCPVLIGEDEAEGLIDNRINLSGYWTPEKLSIAPDMTVRDKDVLKLGEDSLKVISTEGHTKGSVCYLLDNVLFSGDTLFRMSIGRTDLPTGDYQKLLSSLNKLSELSHDVTVLSGHGPQTSIGFEVNNNPYMCKAGF